MVAAAGPIAGGAPGASVRAWKPPIEGLREVLHARFVEHAYPPHTHDAWTLFLVDDGLIRYDLDRRAGGADTSMVSVLPPHVVHDGRTGSPAGYRKRVLYIETSALPERLIGAAVDRPVLGSGRLRSAVSALDDALACVDDRFEAEARFSLVCERVRGLLGEREGGSPTGVGESRPGGEAADALRAYLDTHAFGPVSLAGAASALGWSQAHLARSFTVAFGIAPHAYLVGRRLDAARRRILEGQPLADVATDVGFFDQAHLTHRFKRFLGTTPRAYAGAASSRAGRNGVVPQFDGQLDRTT